MKRAIKVTGFVPVQGGGYKPVETMSEAEREAFSRRLVARMGKAFEPYILSMEEEEDGKNVC